MFVVYNKHVKAAAILWKIDYLHIHKRRVQSLSLQTGPPELHSRSIPQCGSYAKYHERLRLAAQQSLLVTSSENNIDLLDDVADLCYACCDADSDMKRIMPVMLEHNDVPSKTSFRSIFLNLLRKRNVKDLLEDVRSRTPTLSPPTRCFSVLNNRRLTFPSHGSKSRRDLLGTALRKLPLAPDRSQVKLALASADTVSAQFDVLLWLLQLSEEEERLHFFIATILEESICNISDHFAFGVLCNPFGSATNGFGKRSSDLDMELQVPNWPDKSIHEFSYRATRRRISLLGTLGNVMKNKSSQMLDAHGFRLKIALTQLCVKVPILKLVHVPTGVECDLVFYSTTKMTSSGHCMSELLWLYSKLDTAVRPLVFAVRYWAATAKITSDNPGTFITNFQLLWMVLYFLVAHKRRLPFAQDLIEYYKIVDDCPWIKSQLPETESDITRVVCLHPENFCNLRELLLEFFEFYTEFDFDGHALSLNTADALPRPPCRSIYIVNPLDRHHNIAYNVKRMNKDHFQMCAEIALKALETAPCNALSDVVENNNWGLLSILEPELYPRLKRVFGPDNKPKAVGSEETEPVSDEEPILELGFDQELDPAAEKLVF